MGETNGQGKVSVTLDLTRACLVCDLPGEKGSTHRDGSRLKEKHNAVHCRQVEHELQTSETPPGISPQLYHLRGHEWRASLEVLPLSA